MPGQVDLSFASLPRTSLRVYPLVSHFAEKVHAYTRPRERQTRVKDLVDLALLLTLELKADPSAAQALVVTFDRYDTHPLPVVWPSAPKDWADPFAAWLSRPAWNLQKSRSGKLGSLRSGSSSMSS